MSCTAEATGNHQRCRELHPSSDADRGAELTRCFDAALAEPTIETIDALGEAAERVGASMRGAGLRPECALMMLKALLRGHGRPGWSPSLVGDSSEDEPRRETVLYEIVFSHWLAAYFAGRGKHARAARARPRM